MAKTHGQVNEDTGKVEAKRVKAAKAAELGKWATYDTRGKRAARALWG